MKAVHGVSKVIPLSDGVWLFAAVSDVNTVTTVMRCCVMDFRFVLNEALECCVFRSNWQLKRWPTRSAMRWLVGHKNVTVNLSSRREMGVCRGQYLYQRIPACSCLTPVCYITLTRQLRPSSCGLTESCGGSNIGPDLISQHMNVEWQDDVWFAALVWHRQWCG